MQSGQGHAAGVIWGKAEIVEAGNSCSIRQKVGRLAPGQSQTLDPLNVFVGDGDWQTVQGWWRLLHDGPARFERGEARTCQPIELAIEPSPVVVANGRSKAHVTLRSSGSQPLDGRLRVNLPAGLRATNHKSKVAGFQADAPVRPCLGDSFDGARGFAPKQRGCRPGRAIRNGGGGLPLDDHCSDPAAKGGRRSRSQEKRVKATSARSSNSTTAFSVPPSPPVLRDRSCRSGREGRNSSIAPTQPRVCAAITIRGTGVFSPTTGRMWEGLEREHFRHRLIRRRGAQGDVVAGGEPALHRREGGCPRTKPSD